jgi:hypothetical protein
LVENKYKEIKIMAEFVAGKGTTALGIIGTVLGSLGVAGSNGVNGLLGRMGTCSEEHYVNRYEAQQSARIAQLETEVKLRDSNIYTDTKLLDLYKYIDGKFGVIEKELCDQKVYNATNIATVNCIAGQVNQLFALTKLVIPNASICPGWTTTTTTGA